MGLRLLDLDDQLSGGEYRRGITEDAGACRRIGGVIEADFAARSRLDDHLVPMVDELSHIPRNEPDPIFVGLHLFRNADQHRWTPLRPGPAGNGLSVLRYRRPGRWAPRSAATVRFRSGQPAAAVPMATKQAAAPPRRRAAWTPSTPVIRSHRG